MRVGRALLLGTSLATVATLLAPPSAPEVRASLLIVAFALFGALVLRERRRPTLGVATVLLTSGLVTIVAVARPPYGSHDLWSYATYGRILVRYHRNPYATLPAAFPRDPIARHVARGWRHTASMYGPGFTLLCSAIVGVTRTSVVATRLAFQALSAGAFALCCAVIARAGAPRWTVVAIALNPLLLVTVVNGGHVDPLIAVLLVVGAIAVDRRRLAIGALAFGVAVGIKLVVVLPAAALTAWVARHHGRRAALLTAFASFAPAAIGVLAFGGLRSLHPLLGGSHQYTRASMWALLRHVPLLGAHVSVAALVSVAAVTAALFTAVLDLASPVDAVAVGAIGYVVAAAYVLPWYLMWGLPVAALSTRRVRFAMLLGYTAALAAAFEARPVAHPDGLELFLRASVTCTEVALIGVCASILARWGLMLRATRLAQHVEHVGLPAAATAGPSAGNVHTPGDDGSTDALAPRGQRR
ncbi:MAG: hypothetical protein QOK28_3704 [Actinomycetota bacterium]|jgi:hypothetical protein